MPSAVPAPEELFAGVVADYLRHRPPYPPDLLAAIAKRFGLGPGVAVLDVGCGPGILSLPMAATGAAVTGLDPSPEMIAAAEAAGRGRGNLRFVVGTAETAPLDGPLRLALFGRSFHWLDRERVLGRLDRLIEPAGGVVVFVERREQPPAWRSIVAELQRRWLPDGPRSHRRHAEKTTGRDHETVLRESAFARIEALSVELHRRWTLDDVAGYVRSTSTGREALLAAAGPAREAELRSALAGLASFDETVLITALMATRP